MHKYILIILFFCNTYSFSSLNKKNVQYRTFFGSCPSRVVGNLTLKLMKEFEVSESLKDVKEKIIKEKLKEKHFLSDYSINYDPIQKFITFNYSCPAPLMKVQIYKKNGVEYYTAILVENGELFDPTYEQILQSENKLTNKLPSLAFPVGEIDKKIQIEIAYIVKNLDQASRNKISEVIVDQDARLTVILSNNGKPTSAFLGISSWENKTKKLFKVINYMSNKGKIPTIINMTDDKKVVVKFSTNT